MASTKASMEARMNLELKASAPATTWAAANLDEALISALAEYSRAKPYQLVTTQQPTAREMQIFPTQELIRVRRIWFPYTASKPEYPPSWIDFDFWSDNGSFWVLLHTDSVPDGTKVMRVFYDGVHSLNGLNGFGTTTFIASDESCIVMGACGYACLQRSVELDESLANMAVSMPNYGALAEIYFQRFHDMLYTNRSRGVEL